MKVDSKITAQDILNNVISNLENKENPTFAEIQDEFIMTSLQLCNNDFEKGSVEKAVDLINEFYGLKND